MSYYRTCLLIAPLLAASLAFSPLPGSAQDMPEGVNVEVVAEYPLDIDGVDKLEIERVMFEPGVSLEFTLEAREFCNATEGIWTVVNHDDGVTRFFGPGSRWAMPPKGTTVTVANHGDERAVQWVYKLVESE